MAFDPTNDLVPGYPKRGRNSGGRTWEYLYRNTTANLIAAEPFYWDVWDTTLHVFSSDIRPMLKSGRAEMTVIAGTIAGGSATSTEQDNEEYPFYEVDPLPFEKKLRQHPAFAEFTATMWTQLDRWEKETDDTARAAFQYWIRDKDGNVSGSIQTLGTTPAPTGTQQDYARLFLTGVESFGDATPLARKTSLFKGTTMPDTITEFGQKIGGDPFDLPDAIAGVYQWLKTGDSARKQGRGQDWLRVEEWTGSRLILLDKDELFLP